MQIDGTLNISAGMVVKYDDYYLYKLLVSSGGTLNATGTSGDPIIFTSYRDDSVGGDSNGDGPSSGMANDYSVAIHVDGGTADIEHAILRFGEEGIAAGNSGTLNLENLNISSPAPLSLNNSSTSAEDIDIANSNTAISVSNGQANLAGINIVDSVIGLLVADGADVVFRGSFSDISSRAISACKWDQACNVDAAYVDWGSADGPFVGGDDLACGRVTVSPWVYNSTTYDDQIFAIENCDNTPGPSANMSSSITYFQQRINLKEIDCSGGFQPACDAIQTAMTCLGGAMSVAQSTSPWTLPPATTAQEIADFGSLALDSASTYITSQATVSVSGFSFALIGQLVGLIDTFAALNSAYNSCAP